MPPPTALIIRALRPDDGVNSLSLGTAESAPLKTFLRKHAKAYEAEQLARTYVLVDEAHKDCGGRVWGYITLAACEVQTTVQNDPGIEGWRGEHNMPAVKLARLAIDTELQRNDHGRHVLDFAIALIKEHVSSKVGCRFLVTDAKRQSVGFYEKCGFTMLDTEANRIRPEPLMFVHLSKL